MPVSQSCSQFDGTGKISIEETTFSHHMMQIRVAKEASMSDVERYTAMESYVLKNLWYETRGRLIYRKFRDCL